jgi:ABC-type spermidine/putrescine transport system permease subunit II
VRLRFTPEVCLVALLAGSTGTLAAVVLWRGEVNGTRFFLIWLSCVLPVLFIGALAIGRRSPPRP